MIKINLENYDSALPILVQWKMLPTFDWNNIDASFEIENDVLNFEYDFTLLGLPVNYDIHIRVIQNEIELIRQIYTIK
jgi:hypothetical protein